jgi:DNA-binding response OmpR family regulator
MPRGYPELKAAVAAILLQADEVLVKPFAISALVETIRAKLHNRGARPSTTARRVASILESETRTTIGQWLTRVGHRQTSCHERTGGAVARAAEYVPDRIGRVSQY